MPQPIQPQAVLQSLPAPIIHPAHTVLSPHNPAIAEVVSHGSTGTSLVLTPAVTFNSSQTTATAASVLGGMHRVTSNLESSQQQTPQQPMQPAHPPAAFHPSLPQAQPPPITMGRAIPPPQTQPQPEFTHAVEYINRIKTRFLGEPETYKQFLEILQTYQKEQRLLHDVSVLAIFRRLLINLNGRSMRRSRSYSALRQNLSTSLRCFYLIPMPHRD
jgi:paired amphipathic helix protein Sin3a